MATTTTASNVLRVYKDLDMNFVIHPIKKDINKKIGEASLIAAIKSLLLTNQFERPFQPHLGSGLRRQLFEPLDSITAKNIYTEIKTTLDNFEPRIIVQNIIVKVDIENNGFNVLLTFRPVNMLSPIQISIFLERVR